MGRVLLFQGLVGLTEAMYLWLVAAGLSLIFGVLRVLNFAHGALYMMGAYLTYAVFRACGGNFWIALLIGPVLVALIGWAMEVFFLRRVYRADVAFQLLLTFAFVLILDDLVKLVFGPVYQSPPTPRSLSGAVLVFGSVLPTYHLFILGAGGLVAVGLWVVLGGLGSLRGAFLGSLAIGLLHAYGIVFLPVFELALAYLVMAAVLVVRPWGLFGVREA